MTGFPLSAVREENRVFEGESPGNSPTQSIVNLPSDPDEPHRLFEDKSVQAPPWILRPATWDDIEYIDESPPWSEDEATVFAEAKAQMLAYWAKARKQKKKKKKSKSLASQVNTTTEPRSTEQTDRQTDSKSKSKSKGKGKNVTDPNIIDNLGHSSTVSNDVRVASLDVPGFSSDFQGTSIQQDMRISKKGFRDGALLTHRDHPTHPLRPNVVSELNSTVPLSASNKQTQPASRYVFGQRQRGAREPAEIENRGLGASITPPLLPAASLLPNEMMARTAANPSTVSGIVTDITGLGTIEALPFVTPRRKQMRTVSSLVVPQVERTPTAASNRKSAVLQPDVLSSERPQREGENQGDQQLLPIMYLVLDQQQEVMDQQMELFLKMKSIETDVSDLKNMVC